VSEADQYSIGMVCCIIVVMNPNRCMPVILLLYYGLDAKGWKIAGHGGISARLKPYSIYFTKKEVI
jgi:hypothetical protein